MSRETVVLAYSGGLDTSCILKWLLDKQYHVICYMADVGQDEDFESACRKATDIGASKVVVDDLKETFVKDYVWVAIQASLLYESKYLLGTSLARPCIAVGLVKCAQIHGARYIAHGATGKGNDQIRFELACYALWSHVEIIAPWRDEEFVSNFQGRKDLLKYAEKHNIPVSATPKAPWSVDANIMHTSYESGILEDPNNEAPSDLYLTTLHPKDSTREPCRIEICFKEGMPISLTTIDNQKIENALEIIKFLNKIGGEAGIGRIDIVENRFIGLKSRGVYETPGAYILHVAHSDIELFCLDKEVYRIKQSLRDRLSDYVYNGFWFSPEGEYVRNCIEIAQKNVNGTVKLELYKGNVFVLGRSSDLCLYNQELVSMDKHSHFTPSDATGFIKIHALRLKEYRRFKTSKKE